MGRLIDLDKARNEYRNLMDLTMSDTTLLHTLYGVLDNAPTVEAIPKADYEQRLKADLVAMLTELKSNIDELASSYDVPNIYVEIGMKEIENEIQDLIQQKINFLSGL